jgi:predicted RNA-binding Zn ribbon-like protein
VNFGHDTLASLEAAVDLVNLSPSNLATPADVAHFYARNNFSGRLDRTQSEVAELMELQPRLRVLLTSNRDETANLINNTLSEARALPQLVRHDNFDWHIHAISNSAPLAARLEVETAIALIDLLRTDELRRISTCDQPDCDGVVLDFTRNRSRRFCSTSCGNRAAVAAYRARKAASSS